MPRYEPLDEWLARADTILFEYAETRPPEEDTDEEEA